jgi:amidase
MIIIAAFVVLFAILERSFVCNNNNNNNIDAGFVCGGRGSVVVANAFEHRLPHSRYTNNHNKDRLRRSRATMISKASPAKGVVPSPLPISSSLSSHDDDKILSMDAITLSNAIQQERSVTCEQLMKATLNRIDEINPKFNAIILLRDREVLLQNAKNCDRELEARSKKNNDSDVDVDRSKIESLGWLHGIPVAIKDVSNAEGLPTTMGGSPLFCSKGDLKAATSSDLYVEHIVREGAIVIGKTNAPEGGLGSNTFNERWGKTLNPFAVAAAATDVDTDNEASNAENNYSISAGGSSGGAAVAVTTRMLVFADGTDNMGSLRNPAGWNNIYSLRPTAGLIPSAPKVNAATDETDPLSTPKLPFSASSVLPHPASTPGPMARTPLDCARLLQTMVGDTDRFDAGSLWMTPEAKATDGKEDPNADPFPATVRIGWLGDWRGRLPMEDGIISTCEKALEDWSTASTKGDNMNKTSRIVLETHPADNDGSMLQLFDFDKLWEGYNTIRFASTYETYSQQFDVDYLLSMKEGRALIKEELAWELEQGRSIDTEALHRARAVYDEYEEWLRGIFFHGCSDDDKNNKNSFDVLALPSAQVWPFPIEDRYPKAIGRTQMDTYNRWMEVCVPVSLGGLPCVTIPAGFGKNQKHSGTPRPPPLPIGIQMFGRKGDDLKLLRLANEYYQNSRRSATH